MRSNLRSSRTGVRTNAVVVLMDPGYLSCHCCHSLGSCQCNRAHIHKTVLFLLKLTIALPKWYSPNWLTPQINWQLPLSGNLVLMCLPCALSCPRSDPQTRVCHETDQGSLTESESPSSEKIQQPRDLISPLSSQSKPQTPEDPEVMNTTSLNCEDDSNASFRDIFSDIVPADHPCELPTSQPPLPSPSYSTLSIRPVYPLAMWASVSQGTFEILHKIDISSN